jgi:Asp-tRNA(Asn)/Glu-tRNA(Gln) amidotransferase A subunit family amidase
VPRRQVGELTALSDAVQNREISAVDLVREALSRVEKWDAALNCVTALRPSEALAEAEAIDARVARGETIGRLVGVPVLIKDLEDVAGMVTTQGSPLKQHDDPATSDSLVPARLRAEGAVIVGKSNLPEFATEGFTDNLVFGTTRNPWNLAFSPGGSSGGSAAAMASGMVPLATATDGGGSIRIPASMCGLVGIKPTQHVVGRDKVPDWIDFSTYGPFANTVADVRLLLSIEAGPALGDADAAIGPLQQPALPIGRLIAAERTSALGPLPNEVAAAFATSVAGVSELLGLDVQWLDPSEFFASGDPDLDWFTIATAEHVAALEREWVVTNLEQMHPAARTFMEWGLDVSIDGYLAAKRRRFAYVRRLDELLGDNAALLTPVVAATGWLADGRLHETDAPALLPPEVYSTAVQNITGHPAVSVPAGVYANGVPYGLQLTGPRHSDWALLDVAELWERSHPWALVAPGYAPFTTVLDGHRT